MNQKLILGLIIGLGAYYLIMKTGKKKCNCKKAPIVEPTASEPIIESNK